MRGGGWRPWGTASKIPLCAQKGEKSQKWGHVSAELINILHLALTFLNNCHLYQRRAFYKASLGNIRLILPSMQPSEARITVPSSQAEKLRLREMM